MGKFNEKKVPKWCRWLAVDKNGECWAFENKPRQKDLIYGRWDTDFIDNAEMLYSGKPPKNWKDELYQWI